MKQYTVTLINDRNHEFIEELVMERNHWTKREHDIVIKEGFFWSAQNSDYERIYAEVKDGDRLLYTVHFNTFTSYYSTSTIITCVMIASPTSLQYYRNMVVSD